MPVARIAFYAPLKPPDHPIPSGDRQMARMLMAALKLAGYDVFLASRYISYSKRSSAEHMAARRQGALDEAERLAGEWTRSGSVPDLWFCYHPYDKSPDWLGMALSERLGIPVITCEPCKTGQGVNGEWLPWRAEAQRGITAAAMNIVMTPGDREYLAGFVPAERIATLAPFVDPELLQGRVCEDPWASGDAARLLTVAMMRPGAKLDSYSLLAHSLPLVRADNWQLRIAGDGPGRAEIETMFDNDERVRFLGEKTQEEALGLIGQADILVWPGLREAYGMVYLEAASFGVPSVAVANMGVPQVVIDGRTGLLAPVADPAAFAACLDRLLDDGQLRASLARGARDFVEGERSAGAAAVRLREIIEPVLAKAGKS